MKKRLVKLNEGQMIVEKDDEIIVGRNYYQIVPTSETVQVFKGHTLPIPLSLSVYLRNHELKTFIVIFDKIRETGHCLLSMREIGRLIGTTGVSASLAVMNMRKMGIIYVKRYGNTMDKQIDYNIIQKIEGLCDTYGLLAIPEFRKELGLLSPFDVSQRMIKNVVGKTTEKVADPIEDEEYI